MDEAQAVAAMLGYWEKHAVRHRLRGIADRATGGVNGPTFG